MATSDPSSSDLNGSKDVASSSSIQKFLDDQFKARDETIAQLQKELDSYKKKFESLQNNMSPDQPINNRNYDPKKANELKSAINKVIDDMLLSQEHTNRPLTYNYNTRWPASGSTPTTTHTIHTTHTTHTEANSKLIELEDGSNNTNNSSINHATPHMNNINNIIDQANVDSSFVNPQNRPSDDNELINEVTKTSNHNFPPSISDGKPPTFMIHPPHPSHPSHPPHPSHPSHPSQTRRFNNNPVHHYNLSNPNNLNNNNNNNNKGNKKGKSDRLTSNSNYTVFIAWTGSMTQEGLKSLFDNDEVLDIRFLPNKQFAHVDLKNEAALTKALKLNGETKSQEQGKLRVEQGKPRSNSSTENNGQRPQQNKSRQSNNNNNNNNNNKQNGYNSQPKHHKYPQNGYSNHMLPHEEGKEPAGSPKQWHNFRNSSMSPPGTIPTVYPNQLDN